MKLSCNVVLDLLPLYYEEATSEQTNRLLCEHMRSCTACTEARDAIFADDTHGRETFPAQSEISAALKRKLAKRKRKNRLTKLAALLTALLCLAVAGSNFVDAMQNRFSGSEESLMINSACSGFTDIDMSIQTIEKDQSDPVQIQYALNRIGVSCLQLDEMFEGASRYFKEFSSYGEDRGAFQQLLLFVYGSEDEPGVFDDSQISEKELAFLREVQEDIHEIVYLPDGEFRANRHGEDLDEFIRIVSPFLAKYQGGPNSETR